MTISTLQKRIARLNQQKAKLAQEENILKEETRKQRTRHLIELGGLLVKAKLDDLENNELYGALLYIATEINDNPSIIEKFKSIGIDAFKKENINKTPVTLKFPTQPDVEIRKIIRESGLRWNKLRKEWEGYAELDKLQNAVKDTDHTLTKVNTENE